MTLGLSLAATLMMFIGGCSNDDPGRLAVWGTITWKGQPIPSGVVYFSPDSKKGGNGPQGFALIEQGKFDTRNERSKGCMTGPHIANIHAGDGEGKTSGRPYGRSLFASYNVEIDIPPDGGEINIEVPASVPPAPATASEESE